MILKGRITPKEAPRYKAGLSFKEAKPAWPQKLYYIKLLAASTPKRVKPPMLKPTRSPY